jgi:hypothetical protein
MEDLVFYQHKMEQFYSDLVDTMIQHGFYLWVEDSTCEELLMIMTCSFLKIHFTECHMTIVSK